MQVQETINAAPVLRSFQTVSRTTITLIQAIARAYATAQEVSIGLARMFKIPVLVSGWDMPQTTAHIAKAMLWSGYTNDNPNGFLFQSKYITNVLSRRSDEDEADRSWYKKLPVYKQRKDGEWLDEYPYASTEQGGESQYNAGLVSLRAVPKWEQQNRQGPILSNFYRKGLVSRGGSVDPMSWFINFTTFGSISHMYDRSGNRTYFFL